MNDLTEQPVEVIEEAVNELELLPEQRLVVMGIFEWVKRMTEKFGPTVHSKSGERFDWGQALCREQFGINWMQDMQTMNIYMPTKKDLDRAIEWENGDVPEWIEIA